MAACPQAHTRHTLTQTRTSRHTHRCVHPPHQCMQAHTRVHQAHTCAHLPLCSLPEQHTPAFGVLGGCRAGTWTVLRLTHAQSPGEWARGAGGQAAICRAGHGGPHCRCAPGVRPVQNRRINQEAACRKRSITIPRTRHSGQRSSQHRPWPTSGAGAEGYLVFASPPPKPTSVSSAPRQIPVLLARRALPPSGLSILPSSFAFAQDP